MKQINHEVEVEINGQTHRGWYYLERKKILTVGTPTHGSKSARLGRTPPDHLAKILLRELNDYSKK